MANIKKMEEGERVHITAIEAVHDDDDDTSEIFRKGAEKLVDDAGKVVDTRDGEYIIELDKQRLTYPDDDDYVSPCVRVAGGTVYPEWELTEDAPEDKWKPIPHPVAFVDDISRDEA